MDRKVIMKILVSLVGFLQKTNKTYNYTQKKIPAFPAKAGEKPMVFQLFQPNSEKGSFSSFSSFSSQSGHPVESSPYLSAPYQASYKLFLNGEGKGPCLTSKLKILMLWSNKTHALYAYSKFVV